jgi:hypothetical protein
MWGPVPIDIGTSGPEVAESLIRGNTTFTVTCTGTGGNITKSVIVTMTSSPQPVTKPYVPVSNPKPLPTPTPKPAPAPTPSSGPLTIVSPNSGNFTKGQSLTATWTVDSNFQSTYGMFTAELINQSTRKSYELTPTTNQINGLARNATFPISTSIPAGSYNLKLTAKTSSATDYTYSIYATDQSDTFTISEPTTSKLKKKSFLASIWEAIFGR